MESKKVSIIVPVYNAEKYIRSTLESIIRQTHQNLDILVVDDGSTDSSPSICDEFKTDNRVRVFHRDNAGLSKVRQFGIDNAEGEFVCTIDSDDYYDPHFVEKMHKRITETESDICLCGRYDFYDGTDKFIERPLSNEFEHKKIEPINLKAGFCEIGQQFILSDSWNKLYRLSFVRNSNVKFELPKQYNGNDFAFNYKLVLHCPHITTLHECLLNHRILPGSMVHKRNTNMQEGFEIIIDQIYNESKLCGVDVEKQLSQLYYKLMSLVVMNIVYYSKNRHKEVEEYVDKNILYTGKNYYLNNVEITDLYRNAVQNNIVKLSVNNQKNKLKLYSDFLHLLHWLHLVRT